MIRVPGLRFKDKLLHHAKHIIPFISLPTHSQPENREKRKRIETLLSVLKDFQKNNGPLRSPNSWTALDQAVYEELMEENPVEAQSYKEAVYTMIHDSTSVKT